MVVLSRTVGTVVMIGDNVEIEVISINPDVMELQVTRRELRGRLTTQAIYPLRVNEQVDLGDGCACAVADIKGDKARLGLTAPKSVSIHRKEVYDAIRRKMRGGS